MALPGKPESVYVEIFEKKKKTGQVIFSIEYQGPVVNQPPNQGGWATTQSGNQGGQGQGQNTGGYNNPGKLGY